MFISVELGEPGAIIFLSAHGQTFVAAAVLRRVVLILKTNPFQSFLSTFELIFVILQIIHSLFKQQTARENSKEKALGQWNFLNIIL